MVASVGTAFTYFPPPRPRGDYNKSRWKEIKGIDFIVVTLFIAGLTTLLIRLTWGGTEDHPWKSASTIAPIIGAAIIAVTIARSDHKDFQ